MDKAGKLYIQPVTGKFLLYGRAVDPIILVAMSATTSDPAAPTKKTMQKAKLLLDYANTHLDIILMYNTSVMVLNVHSDASYLTEPKKRSCFGGHLF